MRFIIASLIFMVILPDHHAFAADMVPHNINDSARIYNNLGIERYRDGDFEMAAMLFRKSLGIKKVQQGSLSFDMATTYSNLGAVSRRLNQSDEAMLYYDTAGILFLNHHGPDHASLGAVYQNQGNILRAQRDINSALSYYNNALRIFSKNNMTGWVATLYNNIGIAYWMTGEFDEAKEYYRRTLEIRQKIDPASVAFPAANLALCYEETGDMELAGKYYLMAIDAISETMGEGHPDIATGLMNYGTFLIKSEVDPVKGYEILLSALEIYKSVYGAAGHNIARIYMNIGFYHQLGGDLDSALDYFQKSLIANSETFTSEDIKVNPGPDDHVFSLDYMLESLKYKAYAHTLLAAENRDTRMNLEASLETYKNAMGFIERIRMGHFTEDSRLLLSENEHQTFMQAMHVAWKLYELTSEKSFIEEAFVFSERSKAASLLSSIRDVEARSFGGVPDVLLLKEQNLKRGISAYREMIYEEQKIADGNREKIVFWQERVFSLEQEMRQLIGKLEEEYPEYHALKYNPKVTGAGEIISKIGSRDAIVSYVFNDSLVYIFTLNRNRMTFNCIRPVGSAEQQLEKLLEVLTGGNLDRRVKEDFEAFTSSSRYFYKILIDPVIKEIKDKRLVVVPDGFLSYVPFELLLSADPAPGSSNYKNLSFLLRDFSVSYNYSATLWQESTQKAAGTGKRMLAMAPNYEYAEMPYSPVFQSRQLYRDKLMPLPGAREEVLRIAKMMNGEVLLDKNATEQSFKLLAGDYQLLHLAMHTLLDDDNPMFSKLVFAEQDNDQDDGFLNTYEIYNLNLNANLAVLSSCRSGYGTLRRGEGVMSLARGFLYAGVPSIVMTNWEIEDKSGAEIMIGFYKYLLKGYRKDDALRFARLDFLDNTDNLRAHPYFWGAYVCIGNPGEIFSNYRHYYPLVTFILLMVVMVLVLWWTHSRKIIRI
jgi:CHAT domain-containing protein/Tfp pilus assembly protein PilF